MASLKDRIAALIAADPVAQGRCAPSTIAAIALEVEAEAQRRADRIAPVGLDDVTAYLEQRRDNAAAIARSCPHDANGALATDRRQQLEVVIGDLRAGLHLGSAQVRAELLAARAADEAPLPLQEFA